MSILIRGASLTMKKYGYGEFGNLGEYYSEARQKFPTEIIDWFWSFVKDNNPQILDLGCGTGISTRQIAENGAKIIGCDRDALMLNEAKKVPGDIQYILASAENLPFGDGKFHAVTAFSAFHWFANKKAIAEIRRVLKSNGIFCVVNKNDTGEFKEAYRKIIRDMIGEDSPEIKKDYNPAKILTSAGFKEVYQKDFSLSEYFTLSQVMQYVQSISMWNVIPEKLKQETLDALEKQYKEFLVHGRVERKLKIRAVVSSMLQN